MSPFRWFPTALTLAILLFLTKMDLAQKIADEEEQLEVERHVTGNEHAEEGSGNSFNPDDEDDLSASGLPPDDVEHQVVKQSNLPTTKSTTLSSTIPTTTSKHEEMILQKTTYPGQKDVHRPAVSPRPPDETENEGPKKDLVQPALLISTIATLALLAGLALLACCCCCCRPSRRRQRQSEGYVAGREQSSKHYL